MLGGAYSASPTTTTEEGDIQEGNYFKAVTDDDTELRKKSKSKKKKSNSMCRRFSDEQIKSLESVFKMENKLEPRKKLEMARQLGLHPRQVAIWFQNRRARWKSKQVEQDYTSLKADYDTLSHRFESLKKEKHALLQQLRDLCSQLKEPHDQGSKDLDMMSGSENGDINLELNGNNLSGPVVGQDMAAVYSDEDDPDRKHSLENGQGDHHDQFSDEKASNFDLLLGSLFDHSCSDWWDVWSSNS